MGAGLLIALILGVNAFMTSTATPYMHPPPPQFVCNYIEYLEAAAE